MSAASSPSPIIRPLLLSITSAMTSACSLMGLLPFLPSWSAEADHDGTGAVYTRPLSCGASGG